MLDGALWWLAVQVVALAATPLCLALLRPLADRGYGLSKVFGLLLFGYVVWLLVVLQLLPNGPFAYGAALLLVTGGSLLVLRRSATGGRGVTDIVAFLRRRRGLLLFEEGVFLTAFAGFLVIRSYNPNIEGTEKFMDFAFLNAIARSPAFPPFDPWLAPSPTVPDPTINYYYFGYLIHAVLIRMTGVAPAIGFNLALALLFGLAAVATFSLAYGLARDLVAERTARMPVGARTGGEPAGQPPAGSVRGTGYAQHRPARTAAASPARAQPSWSFSAARPYLATGAIGAYLLLVAGNLWSALRRIDGSGLWEKDFWQGIGWNATRVLVIRQGDRDVDYTINEFPSFSFLLGDLHPHVLALPFAVLAVALAYSWVLSPPALFRWAVNGEPLPARTERWARVRPVSELVPGALLLGSLYFLNSWDFPAYFALAQVGAIGGAWWLGQQAPAHRPASSAPLPAMAHDDGSDAEVDGAAAGPAGARGPAFLRTALVVTLAAALAVVLFLPFHLSFRPPVIAEAGGLPLGLVVQRSDLSQFLQFWGIQFLLLAPAVTAAAVLSRGAARAVQPLLRSIERARSTAIVAREAPGWEAALVAGGVLVALFIAVRAGSGALAASLLLAAGAGYSAAAALRPPAIVAHRAHLARHQLSGRPLAFAFAVVCLAALLLAACEVVYIRDLYGGALRRMNTVFKLYYQAWLLFSIGGSVLAFWLYRTLRWRRRLAGGRFVFGAFLLAGVVLLLATVQYPYRVTLLRTNGFGNPATLDGMAWMARFHPEDHAAAEWLRRHGATSERPVPVILEATGGAYTEFSRISTQTGLPTVLGWDQHQRLWRGATINQEVDTRKADVDAIYNAATFDAARPLLDKYGVSYIVVGYLETQKYGAGGGLAKFERAATGGADSPAPLRNVFRQASTAVYQVVR